MVSPEEIADEIERKRSVLDSKHKAAVFGRFKLFLTREAASGDESHPAAVALQEIETGNVEAAVQYLSTAISEAKAEHGASSDEATRARLELRIGDLERWKQSLI